MTKIVTISDEKLVLSSMLTESQFARTNLAVQMEEAGYIIHLKKDGVTFSSYSFGSNFCADGFVYFSGAPFNGKLLCEHLDDKTTVHHVLRALTAAIEKNLDLASVGAGGILVRETQDEAEVLFLPGNLFERSAVNLDEADYCQNQGFYFYKGLESSDALIFLRSVIAYRSLSGNFPFTKTDLIERQADIFDNAFVPLELCGQGIDRDFAKSVEAGLMIFSGDECFEENSRFVDKKKKARLDEILSSAGSFSCDAFLESPSLTETDELRKKRSEFIKKRDRKIFFSRIYRRNKTFIRIAVIVVLVGLYGSYNFYKTNQNLATSKGLTSEKTVQAMYSFISAADVPDLQEIVSGKNTRDLIVKVAGSHVRAKERVGFNENGKIVPVAERLFYKPESQYWMSGITNLSINGKQFSVFGDFPKRKDKPSPIQAEDSKPLSKGDEKNHSVRYFLVINDDIFINVQEIEETVTLFWDGKKWLVKSIDGTARDSRIKMNTFWSDWSEALRGADGKIAGAARTLREKYEWLPSDEDIKFYSDKF